MGDANWFIKVANSPEKLQLANFRDKTYFPDFSVIPFELQIDLNFHHSVYLDGVALRFVVGVLL